MSDAESEKIDVHVSLARIDLRFAAKEACSASFKAPFIQ